MEVSCAESHHCGLYGDSSPELIGPRQGSDPRSLVFGKIFAMHSQSFAAMYHAFIK